MLSRCASPVKPAAAAAESDLCKTMERLYIGLAKHDVPLSETASCSAGVPALSSQQQQQVADSAAAVKRKFRQVPVVAGIVRATPWDPNADVSISIFPTCAAHAHQPGASCGQVRFLLCRSLPCRA